MMVLFDKLFEKKLDFSFSLVFLCFKLCRVSFSSFSINAKNDLLFLVQGNNEDGETYETLFLRRFENAEVEPLEFLSWTHKVFADKNVLLVFNELGLDYAWFKAKLEKIKDFTVFRNENFKQVYESFQISPSGRYVTFVEPTDYVFGDLILYDLKRKKSFGQW